MQDETRKQQIKNTFNTVAEGYGKGGMAFFHRAAAQLPSIFSLRGDENVLDVATGTGIAIGALAPHLPRGVITGLDFSDGMLEQARLNNAQYKNIEFATGDMTGMTFPARQFDAANASFAIFFVEDMQALLQHIASKVKIGGQIVSCSFCMDSFLPNLELFLTRIAKFGVEPPPFSWQRVATDEQYEALYKAAGLTNVQTQTHDVGYYLRDFEQWWEIIWWAGFRGLVNQLNADALIQFKREHQAEIEALRDEHGIKLNVSVIFGKGVVAS